MGREKEESGKEVRRELEVSKKRIGRKWGERRMWGGRRENVGREEGESGREERDIVKEMERNRGESGEERGGR